METAYFAERMRKPFCNPRLKFPPETDVAETKILWGLKNLMLLPLERGLLAKCSPQTKSSLRKERWESFEGEKHSSKKQIRVGKLYCLGLVPTQAVRLPSRSLQIQGSLGEKMKWHLRKCTGFPWAEL